MAPPRGAAGLLALLTLAALLSPAVLAQTDPATSSKGALSVTTDATEYLAGEPVLFLLANTGAEPFELPPGAHIDMNVDGRRLPPVPVEGTIPAGETTTMSWDSTSQPAGTYFGVLRDGEGAFIALVNNGNTWSILAAPTIQVIAGDGLWAPGEPVRFTVTNTGSENLRGSGCGPEILVRDAVGATVHDSASVLPCPWPAQVLAPGGRLEVIWDQTDEQGQPVPPGAYAVQASFGGAVADARFDIVGAGAPPTETTDTRSLGLRISPPTAVLGEPIHFWIMNTGTEELEGTVRVQVRNDAGPVYTPASAQVLQTLPPGASLELQWPQRDDAGAPVPPGMYDVIVGFAGLQAMGAVAIRDPHAAEPAPDDAPPAASPSGEKPLVGRIAADAEDGFAGDYVSFRLDTAGRRLLDLRVAGVPLLRELALPGSGSAAVQPGVGEVRIVADGVTLQVFDNPAGALRVEVPGGAAQVGLHAAPGVTLLPDARGALLRAPGLDGMLLIVGEGRTEALGETGLVAVLAPQRGVPAVTLRAAPAAAATSLQAPLAEAIADQKVAAEAFVAPGATMPATSVVSYAAPMSLRVLQASPTAITFEVDVDDHAARTLVFHLGAGVLRAEADAIRVLLDGEPLLASSTADVLDPDDDGLRAEYAIVPAGAGFDLLVSVPHFSVHQLTVQGVAEVVQTLAPYGMAAGFAVALGAGAYMVRRSRF